MQCGAFPEDSIYSSGEAGLRYFFIPSFFISSFKKPGLQPGFLLFSVYKVRDRVVLRQDPFRDLRRIDGLFRKHGFVEPAVV